jgi:hypothetical protein
MIRLIREYFKDIGVKDRKSISNRQDPPNMTGVGCSDHAKGVAADAYGEFGNLSHDWTNH